jgi:uncharacterized membrane protein (DUF106 family)
VLDLTSAGYSIGLISAGLTLLAALVRSAVLDKEKLKEHKEKLKHHQEKAKEAQKKKDLQGMQHHQQQMMELSMEQMQHAMKPMLFTIIPFILVFNWMGANYGDIGNLHNVTIIDKLPQGSTYTAVNASHNGTYSSGENTIRWTFPKVVSGEKGELNASLEAGSLNGQKFTHEIEVEYTTHNGTAVTSARWEKGESLLKVTPTKESTEANKIGYSILYENTDSYRVATVLGHDFGWFGWYFISSFISSMIFNKIVGNT